MIQSSLQLGPFKIDHPFILAPMAGITNSPFRRLMKKHRSSIVISELVSATGIEYGGAKTLELLQFHEDERKVGLQIFGEEKEHLVKACQYVEKLGADFVDLNLGCPVPKVVKKGAGAAMCRNPAQLGVILKAMVESVKIPVTIKIRTGWDATSRNAPEVVQAATDAGVAWVAIHGRTRAQGYSGDADWDYIAEVKSRARIPIIGNGDLNTPKIAVERYRQSGVDAVLVGRGALRNPFFFEQAEKLLQTGAFSTPTIEDYLRLLQEQRSYLSEAFQERGALLHGKKFLAWYSAGFSGASEFRKKVFQETDNEKLWENGESFFRQNLTLREGGYLAEPFLMGGHG